MLEKARIPDKNTDYVPTEYFNLEVEVELRIISPHKNPEDGTAAKDGASKEQSNAETKDGAKESSAD